MYGKRDRFLDNFLGTCFGKKGQGYGHIRGVLGNKCAGQHNLKTLRFKETIVLGNIWPSSSAICGFFCSALSTTGRWRRAFL